MYINSNENWMRYSSTGEWKLSQLKDGGKWMFFYKEREFATTLVSQALTSGVIKYAKHTKGNSGICCLYVTGTDLNQHRQVIDFMLEHNLIRLTPDIKYFDMAFKFNGQSWSKQYGPNFEGLIKLSDFIDLESGQPTTLSNLSERLKLTAINKSRAISSHAEFQPIIKYLDQFTIDYVNKLFNHQPDTTDINDKFMFLAPKAYNLRTLYKARSVNQFQTLASVIISHYLQIADPAQVPQITKLQTRASTNLQSLLTILESTSTHLDDNNLIQAIDLRATNKFLATLQHMALTTEDYKVVSYLLFLALSNLEPDNISFIQNNI